MEDVVEEDVVEEEEAKMPIFQETNDWIIIFAVGMDLLTPNAYYKP